ncbi:MAG TPA: carbamoyltransferase C-terminal domain-containing protein [Usitatibacter sp.]|jgi:carbamoyltransferase|nr:carbamoyltransferase C-terminal domain-containing protein [Usitatibacter sp.]
MYTIGINAVYHDDAACLVRDGVVVAAAEDERFTHVKHGKRPVPFNTWQLPFHAIDYCLREAGITMRDVDHVAYSFDPAAFAGRALADEDITLPLRPSARRAPAGDASPWDPLFLSYVVNAPRQLASGAPHHLADRFRGITHDGPFAWHYVEHHLSHEASAFLAAPCPDCAVLTMDGRGESATTSYGIFDGREYRRIKQVNLPDSLGLLYEDVTRYLGFLHSSDEYKVMALASYGEPRFIDEFRRILRADDQGNYFVERVSLEKLFGPARPRGGAMTQRHFDIAQSLQKALEETVLRMIRWLHGEAGLKNLSMAGGVALNCVMNARLRDQGPFEDVWVQPAAGDAGTAMGAALWVDRNERLKKGDASRPWSMDHAFLGPGFTDGEIESFLQWTGVAYRKMDDVAGEAAGLLAEDKILGWFQGRMEFGPRALGARSIIASPLHAGMQAKLNDIKDREDFRPVAPVVIEEKAHEWFVSGRATASGKDGLADETRLGLPAPFMLFIFDVRPDKADRIPAVRHVDGTARVQTINRSQNPRYYDVLRAFERRTGVPVLVNTSFNTRGEPIVCTPRDAVECFWTSPLDALVIGSYLLEKKPRQGGAGR